MDIKTPPQLNRYLHFQIVALENSVKGLPPMDGRNDRQHQLALIAQSRITAFREIMDMVDKME